MAREGLWGVASDNIGSSQVLSTQLIQAVRKSVPTLGAVNDEGSHPVTLSLSTIVAAFKCQ